MATAADSLPSSTPASTHASLPASAIATVAPSCFLQAHLTSGSPPIRPNGRAPTTLRPVTLNLGSLTHANGSSLIRLGNTSVVCGVRAEILDVRNIANYRVKRTSDSSTNTDSAIDSEIWQQDLLVPNLELSTGCSPSHLPGSPPSSLAQSISHRLLTLLRSSHLVSASSLKIYSENPLDASEPPTLKAYWTLYIDILVLSYGGSIFSASWLALLAALSDTVLPAARWDVDLESVVCDPEIANGRRLELNGMPVPLSFVGFQTRGCKGEEKWVLLDSDEFEEGICGGEGSIVVDKKTKGEEWKICRIDKAGDTVIESRELREIVSMAGNRWEEWVTVLQDALAKR